MKTRAGFVSNSSSSSFILVFDKKPESADDVSKALFHGKTTGIVTVRWCEEGEGVDQRTAAKDVWHQIKNQDSMTLEEVTEEFRNGYDPDFPDYDWNFWSTATDQQKKEMTKSIEAESNKIAKGKAIGFWNEHKGKFLCSVSYSDNDGDFGSIMEHGNAFDGIPHRVFSHH